MYVCVYIYICTRIHTHCFIKLEEKCLQSKILQRGHLDQIALLPLLCTCVHQLPSEKAAPGVCQLNSLLI